MRRYELTDEQWEKIEDLFLSNEGRRGAPWNDHHQTLNGMFWILCSGAPWRDLPRHVGRNATESGVVCMIALDATA